jgi:hypothetical protein
MARRPLLPVRNIMGVGNHPRVAPGRGLAPVRTGGQQVAGAMPWTPVASLPGYAVAGVRQIGAQIFEGFGAVNLNSVYIRSTMSESEESLSDLARWIGNNADLIGQEVYLIPAPGRGDVTCRAVLWRAKNTDDSFVIVSDFGGTYVYQFRSNPQLALRPQQDRLAADGRARLPAPGGNR